MNDEAGVIISAELVLVLTIGVLAMIVGLSEVAVAINTELKSPEMIERLLRLGAEIRAGTPEDFGNFITEEGPKWAEVIKSSGLKLEP